MLLDDPRAQVVGQGHGGDGLDLEPALLGRDPLGERAGDLRELRDAAPVDAAPGGSCPSSALAAEVSSSTRSFFALASISGLSSELRGARDDSCTASANAATSSATASSAPASAAASKRASAYVAATLTGRAAPRCRAGPTGRPRRSPARSASGGRRRSASGATPSRRRAARATRRRRECRWRPRGSGPGSGARRRPGPARAGPGRAVHDLRRAGARPPCGPARASRSASLRASARRTL